ncbi:hypothetical protein [Mesorhizobium sp. LSJC269B00]|uniref:hypothetical protein n=1 Tax=Mesorhizobium sp. LSJC269B00 TaxID=1287326 RepID=UPI00040EE874|nr:hypothetical protein [Mesorhizobium sp. LSJC269B00]
MLKRIVGQLRRQGPAQSYRCSALQISSPASGKRSIHLNCLMASLASIEMSSFMAGHLMPTVLTQELTFSRKPAGF